MSHITPRARRRQKLYRKALNIKKNNLSSEYAHAKVVLRDRVCEKIIEKFHAFQQYLVRKRTFAELRRRRFNRTVTEKQKRERKTT